MVVGSVHWSQALFRDSCDQSEFGDPLDPLSALVRSVVICQITLLQGTLQSGRNYDILALYSCIDRVDYIPLTYIMVACRMLIVLACL